MNLAQWLNQVDQYQEIPDMDATCQGDIARLARIVRECHQRGFITDEGEVKDGSFIKTVAEDALTRHLGEISEEGYCAGWMNGLEFDIWRICTAGGGYFGGAKIEEQYAADLLNLASLAGSWPVWDKSKGRSYMPLAEWKATYAAAKAGGGE
jgi:hypothetical protein